MSSSPKSIVKDKLASTLQSEVSVFGDDSRKCRSLPFTMLFWVVFMVTQVGHRQVRLQQSMQKALTSTLTSSIPYNNANTACDDSTNSSRRLVASSVRSNIIGTTSQSLENIVNTQGVMRWLSQSLVPQMWAVGAQGKGVLFEFDKIIGGIRIQQTRLGESECPGSTALRRVYNITCYNRRMEPSEVQATDLLTGTHVNDNGRLTFWLDLESDEDTVQAQIDQMWATNYFFAGTQSIWVQSIILNVQVSLMAFAEVHFFLDRAGRLASSSTVFTLPTEIYGNDWLIYLGDIVLLCMVLALLAIELYQYYDSRRKGEPYMWCNKMTVLNWFMVILGTGFSIFFGYLARELTLLSDDLAGIPDGPAGLATSSDAAVVAAWSVRHRALDLVYSEVARLSNLLRWCELSTFWYSLLVLLKFFAVFEGSPRLAMITATLRHSATDVFHFMVVFAVVFLTFALGAYFLFGHQLKEWSNILLALNSSFRALMGDFNFADMYSIAPISAMVWFWIFMSLIFLVMLNMLLAIILDTYSTVKETAKDKSTLWEQANDLTKQARMTLLKPDRWSARRSDVNMVGDDKNDLLELMQGRQHLELPGTPKDQDEPQTVRDYQPNMRMQEIEVLREAAMGDPQLHQPQQNYPQQHYPQQHYPQQHHLQQHHPQQHHHPQPPQEDQKKLRELHWSWGDRGQSNLEPLKKSSEAANIPLPQIPRLGLAHAPPARSEVETPKWFSAKQEAKQPVRSR